MGVRSGPKIPSRGSEFELVTNGELAADSDWSKGTGWSIGSGKATCDGSQSSDSALTQDIPIIAGQTYKISFHFTRTAGDMDVRLGGNTSGSIAWSIFSAGGDHTFYSPGVAEFTLVADSSNLTFKLNGNSSFAGTVDNVSVTPVTSPLVLSLDAMNAKSFAGEPTTNLVTDGDCNDGSIPDNMSFGYESTATIVNCPTDDAGFKPSAKTIKLVKNSGSNGRITFFGSLGTLSTGSGNPYTVSCWFYIPRTSTGTGGTGGAPRWATDNGSSSVDIAFHRTYHQDDKGTWVKLISEWYSVSGGHTHGFRVTSGDPVGALYYMTEVQVEKKDHSTPFVDGSRPVADAWKDLSGNDNHGTFSAEDFGAASQDYFLVRKGGILLPASTALAPQINNPTGGGGLRANPDFPASINFDGTDDHIDFGSAIEFSAAAFTVATWVKLDNVGASFDNILGFYNTNMGHLCIVPNVGYVGKLGVWDSGGPAWRYGNTVLTTGKWHHVVAVFDGDDGLFLYLDGETDSEELAFGGTAAQKKLNQQYIGCGNITGGDQRRLNGKMAQIAMWSTALTHAQIKDMYNSQRSRFGL